MKKVLNIIAPILFCLFLIEMGLRIESHLLKPRLSGENSIDILVIGDSIAAQIYRKIKSELEPKYKISSQTVLASGPNEILGLAKKAIELERPKIVVTLTGANYALDIERVANVESPRGLRLIPWIESFFHFKKANSNQVNFFESIVNKKERIQRGKSEKLGEKLSEEYSLPVQFSYMWDFFDLLREAQKSVTSVNIQDLLESYQAANKSDLKNIIGLLENSPNQKLIDVAHLLDTYHYRRTISEILTFALAPTTTPPNLYNLTFRHDRHTLFERENKIDERESFIKEFKENDLKSLDQLYSLMNEIPQKSCRTQNLEQLLKNNMRFQTEELNKFDMLSFLSIHCLKELSPLTTITEFLITRNIVSRLWGTPEIHALLSDQNFSNSPFIRALAQYGAPPKELNSGASLKQQDEVTKREVLKVHHALAIETKKVKGQYIVLQYPGYSDEYLRSIDGIQVYNLSTKLLEHLNDQNFYEYFKDKVDATTGHLTNKGLEIATKELILDLRFRLEGMN